MTSYYNKHEGDLYPGHIAKSSDINIIQQNIQDAIKNAISDMTEGQSWILGDNTLSDQNSFILTPEVKKSGRYIDQINLAEGDDAEVISVRTTSYRQPIKLSKSSCYSIIVKLQNKSEVSAPYSFELHDSNGYLIPGMKSVVTVPAHTDAPTEFEVIFDLEYYPTQHGLKSDGTVSGSSDVIESDNDDVETLADQNEEIDSEDTENSDPIIVEEESEDEDDNSDDIENLNNLSLGNSIIYLYVEALNKNKQKAFDVNTEEDSGYKWNDSDPTFGIVMNKNSTYGQLLEEKSGSEYIPSTIPGDLYFKEVYANAPTYKCEIGQAVINGDKVMLADTHVTVSGASSYGNVLSYVYMDIDGHLRAENSEPFTGDEPATPIDVSEPHLHIANILTYANDVEEPVIEQSDESQTTRPRSHHERLRRLEKKMQYTQDVAIPTRLKYTLTGKDWIDTNPVDFVSEDRYRVNFLSAKDIDDDYKNGYVVTTDEKGNFIVKAATGGSIGLPISLKSSKSGKTEIKGSTKVIRSPLTKKEINTYSKDDNTRAKLFAQMKNMENDIKEGTLKLINNNDEFTVATTSAQAKETKYNPWDDSVQNRPTVIQSTKKSSKKTNSTIKDLQKDSKTQGVNPSKANIKPITRAYKVVSGKNGANDWASEFPGMTFYTDTAYKFTKLEIPIYKFKNCEGIQFHIWKRQGPNNQTNTVWFEKKVYTSKVYSLKKAKVKGGYQYMENGFLIDFGSKGLVVPKGQYVIVCLPIVKSKVGVVYVDTYKPKNSKDFCIRYYGAANGSHFLLKTRYHEIWYNPMRAETTEVKYSKKGYVVSGTISWKNIEPISSITPKAHLTIPDGTSADIYVDIGGGWKKIKNNVENKLTGSGSGLSFRWKIEFKSNTKDTPVLKYNKKDKYAIRFLIKRQRAQTSKLSQWRTLDKNTCITSKVFDANSILRKYIGDMNFAISESKFSNYEFARIWGTDNEEKELIIDIAASDSIETIDASNNLYYPLYSFHYVDLKLDDIPNTSVDYSNYDATIEEDEHNLRLKLDTEHSYNDNDIRVINFKQFKVNEELEITETVSNTENSSDENNTNENNTNEVNSGDIVIETEDDNTDEDNSDNQDETNGLSIDLTKIQSSETNQILAKAQLENTIDLTKYSGLKLAITFEGNTENQEEELSMSGLALYISSQYETEVPSNIPDEELLNAPLDGLPDLNSSTEEVRQQYANQVIKDVVNNNDVAVNVYYKSIWNSAEQQWEWQQVHDVNSYTIFELLPITVKKDDTNGLKRFYEINIDTKSVNLQYAKEIGLITLQDEVNTDGEQKYSTNFSKLTFSDFTAINNDYYTIFKASEGKTFTKSNLRSPVTCYPNGKLDVKVNIATGTKKITKTAPATTQLKINVADVDPNGEYICYFDTTSKSTKNFKHIGIQMMSDCLLLKNMLELHLIKVDKKNNNNETVIEKIRIPSMNHLYYPITSNKRINLSQVVKKIKTTEKFDKIALYVTNRFKNYAYKLKTSGNKSGGDLDLGNTISLFIGNIVLYKAESFPMLYPLMRMKFYLDEVNEVTADQIGVRKIGAVIQYK